MDLNKAIQFGQLVEAAYRVAPTDLTNRAGQQISTKLGANATVYDVITTIYANDLATDIKPSRIQAQVSLGFIVQQSGTGDTMIAIRGTEGIFEWIHDAMFENVPYPFVFGAGNTEDGFTAMYKALAPSTAAGSPSVTNSLSTLRWKNPVSSLTICGHSLGGALATLLALDVAANTAYKNPAVYTYASPRTGDSQFASTCDRVVPNTFRIADRLDIVPMLPPDPPYKHVQGLFGLNPIKLGIPPKILVKLDIPCLHILHSYLYLLSLLAGGTILPPDQGCVP